MNTSLSILYCILFQAENMTQAVGIAKTILTEIFRKTNCKEASTASFMCIKDSPSSSKRNGKFESHEFLDANTDMLTAMMSIMKTLDTRQSIPFKPTIYLIR